MNDFTKDDMYWSIDVFMEAGKIFSVDTTGYGVIHESDQDRKRRSTGHTKEECINDMIRQLEKLRDEPSEY